jgi:hypothetical protein
MYKNNFPKLFPYSFSQLCSIEPEPADIYQRPCDNNCKIIEFWATKLYKKFSQLKPLQSFYKQQQFFEEFESCNICRGHYNNCQSLHKCTDHLSIMNNLSQHYQKLRTIVRAYYHMRSIFNKLN